MKVFIAGIDGYLGWPLAQVLLQRGHEIAGVDNLARRGWVEEIGSLSAVVIARIAERLEAAGAAYGNKPAFCEMDLCDYGKVKEALRSFQPDTVIHLGQCPSAPYSMIDSSHAVFVQKSNIISTL